jgi:hypothetical protein
MQGMDVLDFSQMISTKLGYPVEPWATKYGTPAWILLSCHHMCGILTGFPVAMMFSDLSDYQWIGLILLGFPCPFMIIQAFDGMQDHAAMDGSYFHLGCAILEFGLMFHQRVWMLTPLALACIADSHSKNGYSNSIPFGFGFAFMSGAPCLALPFLYCTSHTPIYRFVCSARSCICPHYIQSDRASSEGWSFHTR